MNRLLQRRPPSSERSEASSSRRSHAPAKTGARCTSLHFFCLFFLATCGGAASFRIEQLPEGTVLAEHRMLSLEGRRDGDDLPIELRIEGPSSRLLMDLDFEIGVPTRLISGRYRWALEGSVLEGTVRSSSVTFLGGQSDNPNLGGVFQLLDTAGNPVFRVTLPTSEVARPASIPLPTPVH